MWLNIHSNALFTSVMALVGLFFLYICGIFFANLYAKYRRCRAMGVPAWKIICSMPMGFALLWTPGYLLPDNHNPDYVIPIRAKWYTRFTNWIIQNPITTVLSFIIMTVFSESFFALFCYCFVKQISTTINLTGIQFSPNINPPAGRAGWFLLRGKRGRRSLSLPLRLATNPSR